MFREGDRVSCDFFEDETFILKRSGDGRLFFVRGDIKYLFYIDGKAEPYHTRSCLQFVSRPKKVTYYFVSIPSQLRSDGYNSRMPSNMYTSKDQAEKAFKEREDVILHQVEIEEET